METIILGLLNLGIGGVMAGGVLWILWHIVTTTLPKVQAESREALREQQAVFREAVAQIVSRLEKLDERQEAVDRHVKANNDAIAAARAEIDRIAAARAGRR